MATETINSLTSPTTSGRSRRADQAALAVVSTGRRIDRRAADMHVDGRPTGIRILTMGAFVIERAGTALGPVFFGRRKARALLAALVCAGEPVHRERPEEWTALERAEALCTGSFLPEWPYEDWAERRREEIEAARLTILARLAEGELAARRPERALPRYRRLLAAEPECEAWQRGLMRAYAEAGELGLALRQYHACRAVLRRCQGIEPGAQTAALYRTLLGAGTDRLAPPAVAGMRPPGT
jgi:DNA-binding SARP family transcriptional activator